MISANTLDFLGGLNFVMAAFGIYNFFASPPIDFSFTMISLSVILFNIAAGWSSIKIMRSGVW